MKRYYIAALVVVIFVLFPLLIYFYPQYRENKINNLIDSAADGIVSGLSLEQKVGQIIHVGIPGKDLDDATRRTLNEIKPGGVIFFAYNLESKAQIVKLTQELHALAIQNSGIPFFISADQEGGRVYRVPPDAATQFPGAMALGQIGSSELTEEVAFVTAYELKGVGINLLLAPDMDVNNNPDNPVINTRSFGSSPEIVLNMGSAFIRGVQSAGVSATAKHFPGHGDTMTDSHLALPRIKKEMAALEMLELKPFQKAIESSVDIIMSAHILYDSLDRDNPATLSRAILDGLLRKKMGFRGLIMTDAMEMDAIEKNYSGLESGSMAFRAGADIILLTAAGDYTLQMYRALLQDFRSGSLSVNLLDESVKRQIKLKLRRGLFKEISSFDPENKFEFLQEFLREQADRIDEKYASISEKYERTGITLNEIVSRSSISSLHKKFSGLPENSMNRLRLFFRSEEMREAAQKEGISTDRMYPGGATKAFSMLNEGARDDIWFIEVTENDRKKWNLLANRIEKAGVSDFAPQTVALYTGNPFLPLFVPKNVSVIVSFSPTSESKRALVQRVLSGEPIRKAELILKESP